MTHTTSIESTCAPQPFRQVHRWVCSCGAEGKWSKSMATAEHNAMQHEESKRS